MLEKHLSLSARKKESHLHEVRFVPPNLSHLSYFAGIISLSVYSFPLSVVGGQPGRQRTAAFLRGFSGVRLQGAGGPREEDV